MKLHKTGLIWLWIAVLVLIIDRLAKIWIVNNLIPFEVMQLLPFFNLTFLHNTGAAFSFLNAASGWQTYMFSGLAIIVSISIIVWLAKLSSRDRWVSIALCFILGGALGNVWDRFYYGSVIDFFDFHIGDWHYAVFNTADSAICLGAFMLMCHWFFCSNRACDREKHSS